MVEGMSSPRCRLVLFESSFFHIQGEGEAALAEQMLEQELKCSICVEPVSKNGCCHGDMIALTERSWCGVCTGGMRSCAWMR